MRRGAKRALWSVAALASAPLLAALLLYVFSDTGVGRRSIEGLVSLFTRGHVSIVEMDGTFPHSLKAAHVDVSDAKGVWLRLDGVSIEWSPWGFFSDDVQIAAAHAKHATLLRFPVSSNTSTTPDTTRYEAASLVIDRADIAKELTGRPIAIAIAARGHYTNESDAKWIVSATRIGGEGRYRSDGVIDTNRVVATLQAHEPVRGLLSSLAGLPDAGPLSIDARLWGVRSAENVDVTLHSGGAALRARGALDLTHRTGNLEVSSRGPAMAPRPDLSWTSFLFEGRVHGSFDRPEARGHLRVAGLRAAGGGAQSIVGELAGFGGAVRFAGQADGVRIPGREPAVLATSPLKFTLDARLDGKSPLLDFRATHPLLALTGRASFAQHTIVNVTLRLARIAPFSSQGGIELDGAAVLNAHIDTASDGDRYALEGTINAGGPALLSRLLGRNAHLAITARRSPSEFVIDRASIIGPFLRLHLQGNQTDEAMDFSYTASVSDMSRILGTLAGDMASQGRLTGDRKDFAVNATATGSLATKGYDRGPVSVSLNARHLPAQASGTLEAQGRFDAAPLRLSASFDPRGGNVHHAQLKVLEWRSVRATGEFLAPRDLRSVSGHSEFHIAQLADIGLLIGQALKGSVHGVVDIQTEQGRAAARIHATAGDLTIAGNSARTLDIEGVVFDPLGDRNAELALKANGLSIGGVTGAAAAQLTGPQRALHVGLTADLQEGQDTVPLVVDATVDLDGRAATVAKLETNYRGEPFRLTTPAHFDFADGLAVDRFQGLSDHAEINVAGRIAPSLSLTASLRNASPQLVRIFVPSLDAEGTISGDARLTGTLAAPAGTLAVQATGFHMRGAASGLPPATIIANGTLRGRTMTVIAQVDAGKTVHLRFDGGVPLQVAGSFDLKADGTVDLAVLDPVLAADGRRARGVVTLDGRFTGNASAPRASGTASLAGGEFEDFPQGVRVTGLSAQLQAKGDTIVISQLTGKAGRGTISGHGTIALWAEGIPLDLDIAFKNARPVATDLFTADLDANLKLTGRLREKLTLSGTARINQGDINIAESYPSNVAVLDVRRSRNAPPPPQPPKPLSVRLDLSVTAANRIFVRGRGLDAEAGGTLAVKGLSTAPIVTGGFTMRRGELSLGGAIVKFTSGKISFDGTSLSGSFDPALDFTAESTSASVTAKLAIGGHASTPSISLTSSPTLPQDEVLAHLLFGRSVAQLNPFQLAQIAQAFAALGGFGGGFNPLGAVRRTLGLDRLAVGSAASGNGATIEVGKNIGRNIYVGAKQDTGGGSQAVIQIDLTEHLKLQSTVTAVASAVPAAPTATPQENGSSVGLTYEFEY